MSAHFPTSRHFGKIHNALPRVGRFGVWHALAPVWHGLALAAVACSLRLAVARTPVPPSGTPAPPSHNPVPPATTAPGPTPGSLAVEPPPRHSGRIVLLMLGGVSWNDFAAVTAEAAGGLPTLRSVLDCGDLASARLEPSGPAPAGVAPDRWRVRISPAILNAAATLSSGQPGGGLSTLPPATAFTLAANEHPTGAVPGYEDAAAAMIFARRTGLPPQEGSLLNLGWGALPEHPTSERKTLRLGSLADVIHAAGGRTEALGSADCGLAGAAGLPLREWALAVTDGRGMVDGGEIGRRDLARDASAPFGVRINHGGFAQRLVKALHDPHTALLGIEWGDCRRAALYGAWTTPATAAAYKQAALEGVDNLLQTLTLNLDNAADRLLIVAVPELDAPEQWLPVVLWRPMQRGPGSLLRTNRHGDQAGVITLTALHWSLTRKFGVPVPRDTPWLQETPGQPQPASVRIARLQSFEHGLQWMELVQPYAHAWLAGLYALAALISTWVLAGAGRRGSQALRTTPLRCARTLWAIAMAMPVALFLIGPCLQISWRYGPVPTAMPGAGAPGNGGYVAALAVLAAFTLAVLLATASWYYPLRLRRVRIGILWLVFLVFSLAAEGFSLPWNALLGAAEQNGAARGGHVFALLVVSATLVGVAGLTRSWYKGPDLGDAAEYRRARILRRVINLRSAAYWMLLVPFLLWWERGANNGPAAVLALLTCGVMWLRLKLQHRERQVRSSWRRIVAVMALVVLAVAQRNGAVAWEQLGAQWLPGWLATWRAPWWDIALVATVGAAAALVALARNPLRTYFETRYTSRAMISATLFGGVAALVIFGAYGPPLVAFYPLGAMLYEMLSAEIDQTPV